MQTIHGAPSFSLSNDQVEVNVTQAGGHVAPVIFKLGERSVSPYSLSPWLPSEIDQELPVLLKSLRGDFTCIPFGPQENGAPHGQTANGTWHQIPSNENSLKIAISAADISANVTKTISLREGHTAIYVEHYIEGLSGNYSYGNHPILDLSNLEEGQARLSISPFRWASVYPSLFSDPADGAQQALKPGATFSRLEEVTLADGGTTDLSYYPCRQGNDDLVMMVSEESTEEQPFAWTALLLDGYVWFSLKNPKDFPATMFWLSNGGRSAAPWNSHHRARLGIEDICSHFCDSVDISRQDLLKEWDIPTSRNFNSSQPTTLRYIQAVTAVPENFGRISQIKPNGDNSLSIIDEKGMSFTTAVDWSAL